MTALRYAASAALGIAIYFRTYHPWLPYAHRERSQTATGFLMAVVAALVGGLLLSWGARGQGKAIAALLLVGMFAANMVVIAADWKVDPTSHNLLPFEFVILATLGAPAFLGTAIGSRLGKPAK